MSSPLGTKIPGAEPLALSPETRRRHVYILGKSGTGKSTLLRNLVLEDLHYGRGVAVLDPHGDLAEELLDHIPRDRTRELIYFNPSDPYHTPGLNVLAGVATQQRHLLVSNVVAIFTNLWPEFWGPRTEHILTHSLAALLETPQTTLLALPKLLTSPTYRTRILRRVTDPAVKAFFTREFEAWPASFRQEAIAPLLNKVGRFLLNPLLRSILGQITSTIDVPTVLEREQILLANLSKGQLGLDVSSLLGSLLFTQFELATLRRARLPHDQRHPYYLYIDEVQNFALQRNFELVLSESRKYSLALTFANQHLEQLPPPVRAAVFGNVGTILTFQVGSQDAPTLAQELHQDNFGYIVTADELQKLPAYRAYLKTLVDGRSAPAMELRTYPPFPKRGGENKRARVLNASTQRFTRPRARVDAKLHRFLNH
jgi:hypothetical protein